MYTDSHYHPFDLSHFLPQAEEERRRLGIIAAASSCDIDEFEYIERLMLDTTAPPLVPCFAIHPQQLAFWEEEKNKGKAENLLLKLEKLALEKRITAVGECGFDLYSEKFKATEKQQDEVFAAHLEIALTHDLPVVLHVRRALHKIFSLSKQLARCKAVVFHSWPGTFEEGLALLRRKVNVYFSFGNTILNGHKQAMHCCSLFPAERLLTETDAPYQPQRGKSFSAWEDLPVIINAAATLRREAASPIADTTELETRIEENFRNVFF